MNDRDHPFLVAARKLLYELHAQAFLDAARKLHAHLAARDLERRYNPNWPSQPRVPRGHPDGGQWTDGGGVLGRDEGDVLAGGSGNDRLGGPNTSVADQIWPEKPNDDLPVVQVTNRPRGSGLRWVIGGRQVDVTPRQASQLAAETLAADAAVARVRTIDPNWREPSGFQTTAEGMINHLRYVTRTANARFAELTGYDLRRVPILGPEIRLDPAPIIPRFRPPTVQEENAIAREVADWLYRNPVSRLSELAGPRSWIYDHQPRIEAYLEPPKTLEELLYAGRYRRSGFDRHHINERATARAGGHSTQKIEASENIAGIPTFRHWKINGWFATPTERFNGLSPRAYLSDQGWNRMRDVGLEALRKYGVLKP